MDVIDQISASVLVRGGGGVRVRGEIADKVAVEALVQGMPALPDTGERERGGDTRYKKMTLRPCFRAVNVTDAELT